MSHHPFLGKYPNPEPGETLRKWARMKYSELIYLAQKKDTDNNNNWTGNPKKSKKDEKEAIKKSLVLSKEIERGQFNYCVTKTSSNNAYWDNEEFVKIYKERLRSLWANLECRSEKFVDLVHLVLAANPTFTVHDTIEFKGKEHEYKPYDLAFMHHMDWQSWMYVETKQRWDDMNKFNKLSAKDMPDGHFTCGKCASNANARRDGLTKKTTYYQQQLRSADEPMTCKIKCHNCGKQWKF